MSAVAENAPVPLHSVEDCTAAWLTRVLQRSGALCDGAVEAVEYEATPSTTATVAHLKLLYSGGARGELPRRLFLKVGDPGKLPKLPKDFFLGDVRFYERTQSAAGELPTPRCYDAAVDEPSSRFHVLLEDLSDTHVVAGTSDPPDRRACSAMMDCLGDFHAYWWDHRDLDSFGGMPADDEPARYVRSVQDTLPGFLNAVADGVSTDARRWYERFARDFGPAYSSVFDRRQITVVHGDAHPHNILLPRQPGGSGRIVDWQFHHVSVCTEDIRHTLGLAWTTEARRLLERDMLRRYHRRLITKGVTGYTWDDCWRGYRVGVIDNLFMPMWQWTLDMPRRQWFGNIERAITATKELDCLELLS